MRWLLETLQLSDIILVERVDGSHGSVVDGHNFLECLIAVILDGSGRLELSLGDSLLCFDLLCLLLHLLLGFVNVDHHYSCFLLLLDDLGNQVL